MIIKVLRGSLSLDKHRAFIFSTKLQLDLREEVEL
jgi:hypothetical protein